MARLKDILELEKYFDSVEIPTQWVRMMGYTTEISRQWVNERIRLMKINPDGGKGTNYYPHLMEVKRILEGER